MTLETSTDDRRITAAHSHQLLCSTSAADAHEKDSRVPSDAALGQRWRTQIGASKRRVCSIPSVRAADEAANTQLGIRQMCSCDKDSACDM